MILAFDPKAETARLRVAVLSSDPAREAALAKLVAAGGYSVAGRAGDADVVISDGVAQSLMHPRVIVLGDASDDGETAGILPHDATAQQIDAAIRALAAGLSVRLRTKTGDGFGALESEPQLLLTPREVEVLEALVEGLGNKAIARKLDISQHTVKFHVESLFRKLDVNSRTQAAIRGLALLAQSRIDV